MIKEFNDHLPNEQGIYYGRERFKFSGDLYMVISDNKIYKLSYPEEKFDLDDYSLEDKFKDYLWIGPIIVNSDVEIKSSLKKCPYCGTKNIKCEKHHFLQLIGDHEEDRYNFMCSECYLASPLADTEEKASQVWNKMCDNLYLGL